MRVKSGHPEIAELGYRNSQRPRLEVEALKLSDVRRRLPEPVVAAPYRVRYHEIVLITEGRGRASIDLEEQECRRGTLLHVRPGQVRRLPHPVDRRATLEAKIVLFTQAFPVRSSATAGSLENSIGSGWWQLDKLAYSQVDHSITDVEHEYQRAGDQPRDTDLLRHLVSVVLIRLAGLAPRAARLAANSLVFHRFQQELERSFAATRNVGDYAHRLGYSQRTLTRACDAATGRTAKKLINARVVLEAERLLTHTDLPASEIARRLGFAQASNFLKFFAREVGETPGAYRGVQSA